jgi:ABC-2 type transport system permease protein
MSATGTTLPAPQPTGRDRVTVIEPGRHTGHGADHRRVLALAWTLALTDWRLRFYGSALGIAWTLARPFAFFGVIYVVFTEIVGLDKSVDHYGVYILLGLVTYNFFAEITGNSVQALTQRENLLRKMYFPPAVVPLAVTLTALLNLGMTMIAVLIFILANGIFPDWSWLEALPIYALVTIFAAGVGMLLSSTYVRYRDVQPIWEVTAQLLFYATPVLYVSSKIPETARHFLLWNPLAAALTQLRTAIVDPAAPNLGAEMGGDVLVLVPIAVALATFALGFLVFARASPRIAENL